MEKKLKYSILACAYANPDQFQNFLRTACSQGRDDYEVIIVDNATPGNDIMQACLNVGAWQEFDQLVYQRIVRTQKRCTNIAQGINAASRSASGEHLVIVADPNVLLSFNLLDRINSLMAGKVLISGAGTDIKISPSGCHNSEYCREHPGRMATANSRLLNAMGWPDDPTDLELIPGTWRAPDPHNQFDVYVAAVPKNYFETLEETGGWGQYWANWLQSICLRRGFRRLDGVRIIHQYHRVWKAEESNNEG
jgi:hypothetical protein